MPVLRRRRLEKILLLLSVRPEKIADDEVAYREWQEEQTAKRSRLPGLIARADQQLLWSMRGDPHGTHGDYPLLHALGRLILEAGVETSNLMKKGAVVHIHAQRGGG